MAVLFSRGSSQPRGQTQVSHIAGGFIQRLKIKVSKDNTGGFDSYEDNEVAQTTGSLPLKLTLEKQYTLDSSINLRDHHQKSHQEVSPNPVTTPRTPKVIRNRM